MGKCRLTYCDWQQIKLLHSNFLPITMNKLGNVNNSISKRTVCKFINCKLLLQQ